MALTNKIIYIFLAFSFVFNVKAEKDFRCGYIEDTPSVTIVDTSSIIPGRYDLQLCIDKDNITSYRIDVSYRLESRFGPTYECKKRDPDEGVWLAKQSTTMFDLKYSDDMYMCETSIICVTKPIDLLFRGCYDIQVLRKYDDYNATYYSEYETTEYIKNSFTQETFDNKHHWFGATRKNWGPYSLAWEWLQIPITSYTLKLCPVGVDADEVTCIHIEDSCTLRQWNMVNCLTPGNLTGRYNVIFTHTASWTDSYLYRAAVNATHELSF